jgi:hypothetical protein
MFACATPGGAPTGQDHGQSQKSESNQSTVFGKFDLLKDGKQVQVSGMAWLGVDAFSALVLPDGASRALALNTDKQGWFAWRLKPGTYSLRAFSFSSGRERQTGQVMARFTVAENDIAVYIGHITVEIGAASNIVRFRDADQEANEEFSKRNPQAERPTKRLLEREATIGTYRSIRSVCAKEWGVECSKNLQGVEPVSPALTRGIHGPTFTRLNDATPELSWKPSMAADVSYDVAIWEAAAYHLPSLMSDQYMPGQLVVYEENLHSPLLTLRAPLKQNTKYFWSVRMRKGDAVSTWSHAGHFLFLVVAWTSSVGEWFGFETR